MIILRDIRKDIEDGKTPGTPATAEFLQTIREQIQKARQEQKPIGADDVVAVVMNMVGKASLLDEKSAELFGQLVRQVLENPTIR